MADAECDECERRMQRNVTNSTNKSDMCVREGMLVEIGMLCIQ